MARLKVLISGAGIAGNALAFWLSKVGHEVTVVERFPELRTTGLQIDLRSPGIEVMRRMGLEQAFRSKSVPEQGLQIVNSSGRRLGYFPANKSGKGLQNFTTDYEIMRGDLCRLLYDATQSRAKFVFGKSVESHKQKDNYIEIRFTDGKTDRYDLWVGADGSGSRTRKMMLGAHTPDPFYPLNGLYVAYFTIPRGIQEGEGYVATAYTALGNRGVMTRRHNPHEIQVYLSCKTDSERLKIAHGENVKEQKEVLTEIFKDAGWQTEEILRSLKDTSNFYWETLGLVKLQSWSHGRIALLGDAAYCPSANTGMGTTCAMVGAYVLAGEIERHCQAADISDADGTKETEDRIVSALKAYDTKFRPFMDQVQKGMLEESGWNMMPSTAFGIAMMNCIIGVASFLRLNLAEWFLKENVKDWSLPEYEELVR